MVQDDQTLQQSVSQHDWDLEARGWGAGSSRQLTRSPTSSGRQVKASPPGNKTAREMKANQTPKQQLLFEALTWEPLLALDLAKKKQNKKPPTVFHSLLKLHPCSCSSTRPGARGLFRTRCGWRCLLFMGGCCWDLRGEEHCKSLQCLGGEEVQPRCCRMSFLRP